MRRILLVDDERIERGGIRMLLGRMPEEFEIVEAANGVEALQKLEHEKVDFILTDIKMPQMDGMELIQRVRQTDEEIPIAIFSGFGEFSFAQKAIRYGVSNYILKPVKPQEFESTIRLMVEEVENREKEAAQNRESNDYLYRYYLQMYLETGKREYRDLIGENETYEKLFQQIQCMMLLETENNSIEEKEELLREQIPAFLNRKLGFLSLDMNHLLLLFYTHTASNYMRIGATLIEWLQQEFDITAYLAVSRESRGIESYPQLYAELENQLEDKFYRMDQRVFGFARDGMEENEIRPEKTDFQKLLRDAIQKKEVPKVWDCYDKLCQQIRSASMDSQMYIKFIFTELMRDLYEQMQALGSQQMKEDVEKVYQSANLSSICEVVEDCIRRFEKHCVEDDGAARSDVERVRHYIRYHVDEELRTDQLAALVYLSQTYLSYIFKKETGMTISRYIRQCRMEKAKELLTQTDMKIVQVCEKVGFSNVSYFCQSFREYAGMSPERYRKGGKDDETLDS